MNGSRGGQQGSFIASTRYGVCQTLLLYYIMSVQNQHCCEITHFLAAYTIPVIAVTIDFLKGNILGKFMKAFPHQHVL